MRPHPEKIKKDSPYSYKKRVSLLAVVCLYCSSLTAAPDGEQEQLFQKNFYESMGGEYCTPLSNEQVRGLKKVSEKTLAIQPGGSAPRVNPALFPHIKIKPPVPRLKGPPRNTVIDGLNGKFIPGVDQRAPFVLEWQEPALNWTTIRGFPIRTFTTHYPVCVYLDGEDPNDVCKSGKTIDDGLVQLYNAASCSLTNIRPYGGRLFWPGARPQDLTRLQWTVRACNFGRCSNWAAPRSLRWLPPPELTNPSNGTTIAAWSPAGSSPGVVLGMRVVGGTLDDNFFCVATRTGECTSRTNAPENIDPWVNHVDVDSSGGGGTHNNIRIMRQEPDVNDNPATVWFAGESVRWTAAACVKLGRNEDGGPACVYAHSRRITFPP